MIRKGLATTLFLLIILAIFLVMSLFILFPQISNIFEVFKHKAINGDINRSYQNNMPEYDPNLARFLKESADVKNISRELEESLAISEYVRIPETRFKIKVPSSFKIPSEFEEDRYIKSRVIFQAYKEIPQLINDIFDCYQPDVRQKSDKPEYLILNYCEELLSIYSKETNDVYTFVYQGGSLEIKIATIDTNLSAKEWVLDNVVYQGVGLRNQPEEVSRGTKININERTFLSLDVGCCGGYEKVYFLDYADINGQKRLLAFSTRSSIANSELEDGRNVILDEILKTLVEVE